MHVVHAAGEVVRVREMPDTGRRDSAVELIGTIVIRHAPNVAGRGVST
jgi:hypothetical protein